jgi:hypothetical protein
MKDYVALAGLSLLAACASTGHAPPEPIIRTVEVKVPVVQPCPALQQLGPAPVYPDSDAAIAAAGDIFEQVKLILAGRALRIAREIATLNAMEACA